jgi:hypothetical protein
MRRLLYFLACATVGAGILILMSGGTGAGTPFGIGICVVLVLSGAAGSRWGRGPVARGVPAPELARVGLSVVVLCVLGGVMLLWRPALAKALPMWPFLICMAVGGLLLAFVSRMGQEPNRPR